MGTEKDTPTRPATLPAEARFAPIEEWFEVVETKDGHRFGPMRAYRADDGTLLVEARFDAEGRLQGTYKRFHRDGVVAREGAYASGAPEGRFVLRRGEDDAFPTTDPRVSEVHITYAKGKETKRRYLDVEGREITPGESEGAGRGSLDAIFRDLEPANVFTSGAFSKVAAMAALEARKDRATTRKSDGFFLWTERAPRARVTHESFQALFGDALPASIAAWLDGFSAPADALATPRLIGIAPVNDALAAADAGVLERMIREHQDGPGHSTLLRDLFARIHTVAVGPSGQRYAVALGETSMGQATDAVYVVDPASDDIEAPVARSLEDFAFTLALATAKASGALSDTAAEAAYARLRGKIAGELVREDIEVEASDDDADEENEQDAPAKKDGDSIEGFEFRRSFHAARYFHYRSRWIRRLLRGQVDGAYAAFDPELDGGLDDKRMETLKRNVPREPAVGVYWLLRSYFLDEPRVREMIAWCTDSPSILNREAATLVAALLSGDVNRIGTLEDVAGVRAAFLATQPLEKKAAKDDDDDDHDHDEDEDEDDDADDDDDDDDDEDEA